MLRAHAIAISMDGRGRIADYVFVERLWRSLKFEKVYLKAYENASRQRRLLHQALGYRTPRQVFDEAHTSTNSARGKKRWREHRAIGPIR